MRTLYLFEIEADDKPIYNFGEWETVHNLTCDKKIAVDSNVVAYGETKDGKFIELFAK